MPTAREHTIPRTADCCYTQGLPPQWAIQIEDGYPVGVLWSHQRPFPVREVGKVKAHLPEIGEATCIIAPTKRNLGVRVRRRTH
jgi:hypothetical protein